MELFIGQESGNHLYVKFPEISVTLECRESRMLMMKQRLPTLKSDPLSDILKHNLIYLLH